MRRQGGDPIGDVADAVGEVVVDALDEALLGEVGVGDRADVAGEPPPHGIGGRSDRRR